MAELRDKAIGDDKRQPPDRSPTPEPELTDDQVRNQDSMFGVLPARSK